MKNLKTILPMLAFVLAIGMSFAFADATEDNYYAEKYVLLNTSDPSNLDSWVAIQIECGTGQQECTVKYQPSGETFPVYNTPSLNDRADSGSEIITIMGPPPTLN